MRRSDRHFYGNSMTQPAASLQERWGSTRMIAFTFADYEHLIEPLGRVAAKGNFEINRFTNGELFARIRTPVRLAHCVVLGSIAPPDERLLSLALLAHTLKKSCPRTQSGSEKTPSEHFELITRSLIS
jgi:hypothetical protein